MALPGKHSGRDNPPLKPAAGNSNNWITCDGMEAGFKID